MKIINTNFGFRRALLHFRTKNLEKRQFEDSTELIFLFKNVDNIGEKLEEIVETQRTLKINQVKIFAAIKLLTDIGKLATIRIFSDLIFPYVDKF